MHLLNRTRYYVPAYRTDKIIQALNSGVDSIIFDLEDLTPSVEKDAARVLTKYALAEADFGAMNVMVRVNGYDSGLTVQDLTVLNGKVCYVLYAKAESVEEILRLDMDLAEREAALGLEIGTIEVCPAIETAKGLLNSYDIARACKRVTSISIGGGDMAKDLKAIKMGTGVELLYAKSHLITVARAAEIEVLDTVYPKKDEAGLIRETEESFMLGFDGKGVISNEQVPIIHKIYVQMKS